MRCCDSIVPVQDSVVADVLVEDAEYWQYQILSQSLVRFRVTLLHYCLAGVPLHIVLDEFDFGFEEAEMQATTEKNSLKYVPFVCVGLRENVVTTGAGIVPSVDDVRACDAVRPGDFYAVGGDGDDAAGADAVEVAALASVSVIPFVDFVFVGVVAAA